MTHKCWQVALFLSEDLTILSSYSVTVTGRDSDSLRAGLSGDRIPVEARFSAPVQTGPGAHPASCTMGTRSLSRRSSSRGVALTTYNNLVPRLKKE